MQKTKTVCLTVLHIDELRPIVSKAKELISEERYRKMTLYKKEEDRLRSFGAALLLKYAAKGEKISYAKFGKPFAAGNYFNISHSGEYVVLAEAERNVGVDIEEIQFPFDDLTIEALSAEERAYLDSFKSQKERAEKFYTLWTIKESVVKCEGEGFSDSPSHFTALLKSDTFINYKGKGYGVSSAKFQNYILSVALEGYLPLIA